MAKTEVQTHQEGLQELDPSVILADENSRYSLKQSRIDSLADAIVAAGGVNTPIEVMPLEQPTNGYLYKATVGHYRLAAVNKLNKEQKAGLTIPAIVKLVADPVERLKRQLSENMDRENQSPMDQAIAIQKLVQAGVPKMDIRKIFSRPGGRKGNQIQPASNSFINMTLSFLDLPKPIQEKIHDGRVGVAAAYQLTKVPAEKRSEVLEAAEAEHEARFAREEKDEEKFLKEEAKESEQREKQALAAKELEDARALAEKTAKESERLGEIAAEAYKKTTGKLDAETKKANVKAFGEAQAAVEKANKEHAAAERALAKLEGRSKTAAQHAAERAKKLADARKQAEKDAKKAKTVSPQDVQRAASRAGASDGKVALNATEMRKVIADMSLAGSYAKVQQIGLALKDCFESTITANQLYSKLAVITGEKKGK